MSAIQAYTTYLQDRYEAKLFRRLTLNFTSSATYDPSNLFVYIPIDRQIAWTARTILWNERFRIRHNIFFNIQASK